MFDELFKVPNLETILTIAFGVILTENVILVQTLGICPFLGVSKKRSSALGMGLAVTFVILILRAKFASHFPLVIVRLS